MAVMSHSAGPGAQMLAEESDLAAVWLRRFSTTDTEVPVVARELFHALLAAFALGQDGAREAALAEAAQALGVLRAHQGHGASTVLEDVLALRSYLGGRVVERQDDGDLGELLLLRERLVQLVDDVLRAVVDAYVEETGRMLAAKASRDPLTGLLNRGAFADAVTRELARGERAPGPSLLVVDLDRFKAVNDTAGHLEGDRILVNVAALLQSAARRGDVVARIGGDEFAVLLPETDPRRAVIVAQRLIERAAGDEHLRWARGRVGLSVGVGHLPEPGSADQLVAVADAAMYRAKRAGGCQLDAGADVYPLSPDRRWSRR